MSRKVDWRVYDCTSIREVATKAKEADTDHSASTDEEIERLLDPAAHKAHRVTIED